MKALTLIDFPDYRATVTTEGPGRLVYITEDITPFGRGGSHAETEDQALALHTRRSLGEILWATYFACPPPVPAHTYRYVDFGDDY